MKLAGPVLFLIVAYGIATQWIASRWAWGAEQAAILGFACWLMMRHLAGRRAPPFDWRTLPMAGAVVVGLSQILFGTTVNQWQTRYHVLTWLTWLAGYWVATQVLSDRETRERWVRWAGGYSVALAALAMLHRHMGDGRVLWKFETGRSYVMGVFPYDNQYAAFVMLVLPALVRAGLTSGKSSRWWMIGAGLVLASVFSSGSVGGSAVLIAVLLWAVIRNRQADGGAAIRAAALVVVVAVIGAAVVGWKEMATDLRRVNPYGQRRQLLESTIEMTRDRWLTGWGLGTWPIVYPAYARFDDGVFDNAAHNDWAQWAAEGGLPLLAMMILLGALIARPAMASTWGIGLAAVLLHSIIEFHFQERPAFGAFYFVWAGALAAERRAMSEDAASANTCASKT